MAETRLSTLDASFLEVETPTAHMHVGWAARFAPPEDGRECNFEELREHIAGRLGRAPRYRQRLPEDGLDLNDPVWIDDPHFEPDRHIRHAKASELGDV